MAQTDMDSLDLDGFVHIESVERDGKTVAVYAKPVPMGCDKRTVVAKDGVVESDNTEFKNAAYLHEWIKNGTPWRYELIVPLGG